MLDQGNVVVWLNPNNSRAKLLRTLRRVGIREVYCQEITKSDMVDTQTALSAWYIEHYTKEEQRLMEAANQDLLRDCMNRINKAKELLAKNKQEGASDGRQEFDSKQG